MIPIRLVIDNFSCFERSEIDFTKLGCATLIVGKGQNNDSVSNGVGKTSIFKAIEYVLFNESEESLEKVIRDDCNSCKVIFYFMIENQLYRVSRSRNRKGISDLSLHKRTANDADDSAIFLDTVDKDSSLWKDIASRRTGDTEKNLEKLIRINYKAFRNTVHFVQHDFSGIATLTPEKRKLLLKEVLQIIIYSKLEKIAKDRATEINREIIKYKTLMESINDPDKEMEEATLQIDVCNSSIQEKKSELEQVTKLLEQTNNSISDLNLQLSSFEDKTVAIKQRRQLINNEATKIKSTIQEYTNKKNSVLLEAQAITKSINAEVENKNKLSSLNFEEISSLEKQLSSIKEEILVNQINSKNLSVELEDLKIPMPDDSVCKHCRQPLTKEHKLICQKQIDERILEINTLLKNINDNNKILNTTQSQLSISISQLSSSKKALEQSISKIDNLKKEYETKKRFFEDYDKIIKENTIIFSEKEQEFNSIKLELENLNTEEIKKMQSSLEEKKSSRESFNNKVNSLNKEITHYQSTLAVLNHKIQQSKDNLIKKKDLLLKISETEEKLIAYPSVIQAFSSSGIPNLIIQNELDEWQTEANNILSQIRPGLQLSFYIEKEKDNGEMADTLDIEYYLNNKQREYGQLSGAQKVSVMFALKLGLAFLLSNMFGVTLSMLLLDEVDSPFDPLGVAAYVDIVKYFQKDFTILIITHNDRLKDKFSHAILVEQDQNMVSKAKVVSSW